MAEGGVGVDLDEARATREAARREAGGKVPTAKFRGETFDLPTEMPFDVLGSIAELGSAKAANDGEAMAGAVTVIARSLFGDRYQEFMDLHPSVDDVQALMEELGPVYGSRPGESEASGS